MFPVLFRDLLTGRDGSAMLGGPFDGLDGLGRVVVMSKSFGMMGQRIVRFSKVNKRVVLLLLSCVTPQRSVDFAGFVVIVPSSRSHRDVRGERGTAKALQNFVRCQVRRARVKLN